MVDLPEPDDPTSCRSTSSVINHVFEYFRVREYGKREADGELTAVFFPFPNVAEKL